MKYKSIETKGLEITTSEKGEKKNLEFKLGKTKFTIEAGQIIELISKSFQMKEKLFALTDVKMDYIPAVDVERTFKFKADKNLKKGEVFTINLVHPSPYALYELELSANLAKARGEVYAVPLKTHKEVMDKLKELNQPAFKEWYKSQNLIK